MTAGTSAAVRQIEYWYKHYLDAQVQEARSIISATPGRLSPVNPAVMARAHEQAWRHAIVRAQRNVEPEEWGELTVEAEAACYQTLLEWGCLSHHVELADVVAVQTSQGYRHHPR